MDACKYDTVRVAASPRASACTASSHSVVQQRCTSYDALAAKVPMALMQTTAQQLAPHERAVVVHMGHVHQHTLKPDPFSPFVHGRFLRNPRGAARCLLRCCNPSPGALDAFKLQYAQKFRKTPVVGVPLTTPKEPSHDSWMTKYRGDLRSSAFTKLSCSKVGGFVSLSKVLYERCRMNFCFGWSDAEVRALISTENLHGYILPRSDRQSNFSKLPDFRVMHCVED